MAGEELFSDLPPPRIRVDRSDSPCITSKDSTISSSLYQTVIIPKPAIKRPSEGGDIEDGAKKVRFKTTTEASAFQVADAMRKIASHIGNASKFSKASKLAIQLLDSGSLNNETSDLFFDILKASMTSPSVANLPNLRQDYHELFSVVLDKTEVFSHLQRGQLEVWMLWAIIANDFFTDDTFVFSKAANKVKQHISALPEATAADDVLQAMKKAAGDVSVNETVEAGEGCRMDNSSTGDESDNDPFGLNELMSKSSKKEDRIHKEEVATRRVCEEESRLLQERREALMTCLEIAAGRYRVKWAQTIIDILAKHAFDNISRFTSQQRSAVENLWSSVKEQQIRRKQGKTATGKLDVTGFERLQSQYSRAKISIRHSVGADGDRSAEQWLG